MAQTNEDPLFQRTTALAIVVALLLEELVKSKTVEADVRAKLNTYLFLLDGQGLDDAAQLVRAVCNAASLEVNQIAPK